MKSILIFIFIFLSLIVCAFSQTTINIFNNNKGCNGGCNKNERYHVYYDPTYFNGWGRDNNATRDLDQELWNEILRRNPTLKAFRSPTYSLTGDLTKDFYEHVSNCDMDSFFTSNFYFDSLSSLGLLATDSLFYFEPTGTWTTWSNLPRAGNFSDTICSTDPTCAANGFCSNYSTGEVANFAKQNNAQIKLHYFPGSFYYDYALVWKARLQNESFSNVELVSHTFGKQGYIDLLEFIATEDPKKTVHISISPYYDDEFCEIFRNETHLFNLTLFDTFKLPNYRLSYVFCPQKRELFDIVQKTLKQLNDEYFLCQLGVKHLGFCNDTSIPPNLKDKCSTYNGLPECSYKRSENVFRKMKHYFN